MAKAAKRITVEAAAALVRPGMWLDYGAVLGQPDAFDEALAARLGPLSDIRFRSVLTARPRAVLEADPEGKHVHWFSTHFSGYDRRKHDAGMAHYLPVNLGEVPDYYRRFIDPPDIVVFKTAPMDERGFFNFGPNVLWMRALVERGKLVIVEETSDPALRHG
jgi:acyl-CoA hydrolase